jgi:hypothetical protein
MRRAAVLPGGQRPCATGACPDTEVSAEFQRTGACPDAEANRHCKSKNNLDTPGSALNDKSNP